MTDIFKTIDVLAEDIEALRRENQLLSDVCSASVKTLNENLHLCDGENCTLRELRDAVARVRPDWEKAS